MRLPGASGTPAWRRISLEKQLLKPRFPAGVGTPSAVCFVVLALLGAFAAVYLGQLGNRSVPLAVIDSQEQLVDGVARDLRAAAATARVELTALAAQAEPAQAGAAIDGDQLLAAVNDGTSRWLGTAVLDDAQRLVAAQGQLIAPESVPEPVDGQATVARPGRGGEAELLIVAELAGGWRLAATTGLRPRQLRLPEGGGQSLLLAVGTETLLPRQGPELTPDDPASPLVSRVAAETVDDGEAASAMGTPEAESAPVVAAAPVGDLGMAVVSVVQAPVEQPGSPWLGVVPGAALVAVAAAGLLLIRLAVVRPVRRLRETAIAVAAGDPVPSRHRSGTAEVRRISLALYQAAARMRGLPPPRKPWWRGVPAVVAVVVVAIAVLGWAGTVMVRFADGADSVPAQIVDDTQNQVDGAADAVNDSLGRGLTQLEVMAADEPDPAALAPELTALAGRDSRYRSLYVTDPAGAPVEVAGREALRTTAPLPDGSGVTVDESVRRLPVIYAYTPLADGYGVVGEFDVRRLSSLLAQVDGRLRVVDPQLRVVLDTGGYRAFEQLGQAALRELAQQAGERRGEVGEDGTSNAPRPEVRTVGGTRSLVAGTPLAGGAPTEELGWVVVAERPLSDYRLVANELRRGAGLVGVIALFVAVVGLFGWHYLVLLMPLQQLAARADRLAAGDYQSVISPHRPDEIGAVATCLEVSRQAVEYGPDRLGGATRLRGPAGDQTMVLPQITGGRHRPAPATRDGR